MSTIITHPSDDTGVGARRLVGIADILRPLVLEHLGDGPLSPWELLALVQVDLPGDDVPIALELCLHAMEARRLIRRVRADGCDAWGLL